MAIANAFEKNESAISLENEVDVVADGIENSLISPLTLKHEKASV